MMEMKLVVFMEAAELEEFKQAGRFSCRPEADTRSTVKNFCSRNRNKYFAYPEPFVSIAVLHDAKDICSSAAAVYGLGKDLRSPHYVILIWDSVCDWIDLAADGDLKNITYWISKGGSSMGSHLRQIRDVRQKTADEKRDIMRALARSRTSLYTEARLNRPLSWNEVENSGYCDR
jgi:hypothetical protein